MKTWCTNPHCRSIIKGVDRSEVTSKTAICPACSEIGTLISYEKRPVETEQTGLSVLSKQSTYVNLSPDGMGGKIKRQKNCD